MSAESPCENQLRDAIICVEGNTACTPCFEPNDGSFADEFPQDAENAFRKTLAFIPPQQSGFCMEANYRVCEEREETMYCCCEEEIEAYYQCSFDSVWVAKFGVVEPCQYKGCGGGASGDDGATSSNSMIYIIVGACTGAILILCGLLFWRFRRMKAAKIAESNKKARKADKGKDKKGVKKDSKHKNNSKNKKHLRDIETGSDDDDDSSIDDSDHRSRKSSKSKHHKETKSKGKSTRRLSDKDDSESTSGRSKSHRKKKSSSSESTWSVDSEGNSKNSKKNKKVKAEEAEKERLRAEREAKMARLEKRASTRKLKIVKAELGAELAVTEAEKKAMAKKMKKMERERLAMEEQIAELEEQNVREAMLTDIDQMQDPYPMVPGNNMVVQSYGGMPMNMQQHQHPPMAAYYGEEMPFDQSINSQAMFPPVNMVAVDNEETVDDFVTLPPDLEIDQPAGWLGHEISRRAEHQFTPQSESGMADPDGGVDGSARRRPLDSSSHSRSKHKSRSRSRSNERMHGVPRKPRSLENLAIGENEDYNHPMPQRGLTRTQSERRKPRSLENLAVDPDDYNVPTRGLSRTISERHSRSMRNSSRMVDHTGQVADSWSKSDHVRSMNSSGHSASGRHRSRSKDALDRKVPARSKSDSVRKARSTAKRTNSGEKLDPTARY